MTHSSALSPQAQSLGGPVSIILGNPTELARYAQGSITLLDQRAIGALIVARPELNTEKGVGILLWLSSFHGEEIGLWLNNLIVENGENRVFLVIEYLYEVGDRSDKRSIYYLQNDDERETIASLLGLLEIHDELELDNPIETAEALDYLIRAVGGICKSVEVGDAEQLAALLDNQKD